MLYFAKKSLALFCLFGLSACTTLGPNYQKPQVEWLDKWQPDSYTQLEEDKQKLFDLEFWWLTFDDPVLNQLIEIAKQQNIDLRIAGLRILESRAKLGIAGSSLYPQLQQVNGNVTAAETRRQGGTLPDDNQSLVSYQAGLTVGWELDFWGKFQRGIESADAAFFNSMANYQSVQVLLSSTVADLYFSYRTTEQRIKIARKNAEIQKRSYQITEQVYLEGQESELDLQQAKSQYLATLSTIPKLQISLIKTRNALATILARPPGIIDELTPSDDFNHTVFASFPINDLPANLLLRRPDIRASAWQVAAQSAQIGIAESDFYPSISLLGSLSWTGNSVSSAPDNGFLGVGPAFAWNIFDHGRIENNIRIQDARLQQLIEQYQSNVLSAAREVDDAAISIIKTAEQVDILSQALVAAERGLSLANTRYREGYSSFQRVLDAQRSVFSQAEQEIVNRGSHMSAVIALYKALGGGWSEANISNIVPDNVKKSLEQRTNWGDLLDAALPLETDKPLSNSGVNLDE